MTGNARHRGGPRTLLIAIAGLALAACSGQGPILANPTAAHPGIPSASPRASHAPDPIPIELPRDDGPHDRLTEWWYYTGHLRDASGGRWGFEFVVFRAERGDLPVSWASHLALTDESGGTFRYDQRSELGPQVDQSTRAYGGFALAISGGSPRTLATPTATPRGSLPPGPGPVASAGGPWLMAGRDGTDHLAADSVAGGFGLALDLATTRPAALHGGNGFIDFGAAGGSYYYSRTRMAAQGTLRVGTQALGVQGSAWFDHQWGDFIAVGGGGWDWFAINLDDGTDLMLSLVRDRTGGYPLVYATLEDPSGQARNLDRSAFSVAVTGSWTSPRTGATYPAGWRVSVPGEGLSIDLRPSVADQELDTRATTGVVYWEGSQIVSATRNGRSIGGEGYVELTGYAASAASPSSPPAASPTGLPGGSPVR